MATSLKQISNTLVMTNQLEAIEISTDLSMLRVVLTDEGEDVYEAKLYSYEGLVTVYDFRRIVEFHMRRIGKSYARFVLTCFDASNSEVLSETFSCLYCNIRIRAGIEDPLHNYFLTTLTSKRTHPHSTEYLSFLHSAGTFTMKAHCVFKTESGEIATSSTSLCVLEYKDEGVAIIGISYNGIIDSLEQEGWNVEKLMSYNIEIGKRVFTYYVHRGRPTYRFKFWNCFNVPEIVSVNSLTKSKTKIERELASVNGRYSTYDHKEEKEYEVETSALTSSESEWIEQLFMSGKVSVMVERGELSYEQSIVITDSTCEISDGDTEMNRVKFTWRYATAISHDGELKVADEKIYDEQFGYQYG